MWFTASLLLEDVAEGRHKDRTFWEDRIVLVEADDADDATQKAQQIGVKAQHSYVAANGDHISVTFRSVERVYEVQPNELKHGVELFSRTLRTSEIESLLTPFD